MFDNYNQNEELRQNRKKFPKSLHVKIYLVHNCTLRIIEIRHPISWISNACRKQKENLKLERLKKYLVHGIFVTTINMIIYNNIIIQIPKHVSNEIKKKLIVNKKIVTCTIVNSFS